MQLREIADSDAQVLRELFQSQPTLSVVRGGANASLLTLEHEAAMLARAQPFMPAPVAARLGARE